MDTGETALLHDIAHEVATLSALVAAVRVQGGLDAAAGEHMRLVEREVDLLLDLVGCCCATSGLPDEDDDVVDLRELLAEVVAGRHAASRGSVALHPGPGTVVRTHSRVLRRLVTNLVDNAVRAAGPAGRVEVELVGTDVPRVRVLDDGPGPGRGPAGDRGMGLTIVRTLGRRIGVEVALYGREGGGAVAEVVLPGHRPSPPVRAPREEVCA